MASTEPGGKMGRKSGSGKPQLEAKARQASKLTEIREARGGWSVEVVWWEVGPSANIIKRILSSPKLPPVARRKVEEFVEGKITGLYGHSKYRAWSHDQFCASPQPTSKLKQNQLHARWTVN